MRRSDARCVALDDGCGREQSARWCAIVNEYWAQAFIGSGRWFFHDCSRTDICEARWPAGVEPVRFSIVMRENLP